MNLSYVSQNWRTTLQSILTAIIGLGAIAPSLSILSPKVAGAWVAAGGVAKVILGVFQKDAGTTLAETPTGVQAVPSHEVPDDPSAKAISTETK